MKDPEKLKNFLDNMVGDESLKMKPDGTTFCNVGVRRVCQFFDFDGLTKTENGRTEPMTAREIIAEMKLVNNGWLICEGKQAADFAQRGGLGIAFMENPNGPHDHVAAVYPAKLQPSGSLNKLVPMVANIGKKNGVMLSSGAFPVAQGEARYAILVG